MLKLACLLVGLLATSALADVSSILDAVLSETRGRLPDDIAYRPLHYADKTFDHKTREYVKVTVFLLNYPLNFAKFKGFK